MTMTSQQLAPVVSLAMLDEDLRIELDSIVADTAGGVNRAWDRDFIDRVAALDVIGQQTAIARLASVFKAKLGKAQYCKAIKAAMRTGGAVQRVSDPNLPTININSRPMREVVAESIQAIQRANNPAELFVRASKMVYIGEENDRHAIVLVSPDYFRSRLEESANWVHSTDTNTRCVQSPLDVTRHILAQPASTWGMPGLEGLVETPTLRRDGSVLDTEGYDEVSGLYYLPAQGLTMPHIPDRPTSDEVAAAVVLINRIIADFPFADDASIANYFALLLTPVLRQAIDGCTPLALIDAPCPATGKTLLTDVFAISATGRETSKMALPDDNTELNKIIGASLMAGKSVMSFDNVTGVIGHPALAAALTGMVFETRILGMSKNMEVPNRATWVANGNHMRPSGDMLRRCYWVRLNAKVTDPGERSVEFKIPCLTAWVAEHRGELLRALLVIARAWYVAGCPKPKRSPLASFEEWSIAVGGILEHVGVNGFLENGRQMNRQSDVESAQWEAFLEALHGVFDDAPFTSRQLAAILQETDSGEPTVRAKALADMLPDSFPKSNDDDFKCLAGKRFGSQADVRFGQSQIHITRGPVIHGSQQWQVLIGEGSTQL